MTARSARRKPATSTEQADDLTGSPLANRANRLGYTLPESPPTIYHDANVSVELGSGDES